MRMVSSLSKASFISSVSFSSDSTDCAGGITGGVRGVSQGIDGVRQGGVRGVIARSYLGLNLLEGGLEVGDFEGLGVHLGLDVVGGLLEGSEDTCVRVALRLQVLQSPQQSSK